MIAALQDYRRIARVTTVQRDPRSARLMKSVAALLVLALAIGTAVALARHSFYPAVLGRAIVGMAGFWMTIMWAMLFMPGSVLINSAANARLLPRQRRRLMQMAAVGWLLCTLACAVAIDSLAALPLAGFYLIGLPLMMAGHRQAMVLVMSPCLWPVLSRHVLPHPVVATLASRPSLLVLTALLLPAGAYALRLLYPDGGDAFLDRRGEQVRRIQRFGGRHEQGTEFTHLDGPGGSVMLRFYAAMLRRDCRKADPGTMLMHALGPVAHWSAWLGAMCVLLLVGAGVRFLEVWGGAGRAGDTAVQVAVAVSGVMAVLVLFSTAAFGQQVRRTRGEQALLRLTPVAGDAALLNRRLATQLIRRTLQTWLGLLVAILAASWLIGADHGALLRQFALCCLAGQVATMGLLGDYALDGGWNLMLALRAALVAALEAGVAVGLGWLLGTSVWPWMIVIAVVVGVAQLRFDWHRMLMAPVAFPAQRLS